MRNFSVLLSSTLSISLSVVVLAGSLAFLNASLLHAQKRESYLAQKIANFQLEIFRLENKQKIHHSKEIVKAQQRYALEQLTAYSCLTEQKGELGFWRGADLSSDCTDAQKRLRELSPHSIILTCISLGQDSVECSDAYSAQQTLPWEDAQKRLKLPSSSNDLPKQFRRGMKNMTDEKQKAEIEKKKAAFLKRKLMKDVLS